MPVFRQTIFLCAVALCFVSARCGEPAPLSSSWSSHTVLAVRTMAVLSSEVNNRVKAIRFEMGQEFQAGDVLVEFDDVLARARVDAARAASAAAVAAFEAVDSLFQKDSASLVERESMRRDMEQAKAALTAALYELDGCRILAPYDGRVADVYVNAHELVSRGTKILAIVDDSQLLAKFLLPESEFGQRAIGDQVLFTIPVLGVSRRGSISHIAAVMDPASRTFDVWAAIDNQDGALRAGMIARLMPTLGAD